MRSIVQILSLGLLLTLGVKAQSSTPDCQFTVTFTSTTPQTAFSNKPTTTGGTPCTSWRLTYWTNGASGVSVQFEGAKDVAGAADTSFTALTATQNSTNPATGTNQGTIVACCDYYPWLRVNPGTFTGTNQRMTVRGYGYKASASGPISTAVVIAPNSSVNVAQVGGTTTTTNTGNAGAGTQRVVLASDQPAVPVTPAANSSVNVAQVGGTTTTTNTGNAGAGTQRVVLASDQPTVPVSFTAADPCFGQVKVNALISGTANAQIITGTSAKKTYICALNLVAGAATNIALVEGSGTVCATNTLGLFGGTTAATGWNLAANGGIAFGAGIGTLAATTVNANNVCLFVSAANQVSGSISYVVQ